jgi:hypothetical protein
MSDTKPQSPPASRSEAGEHALVRLGAPYRFKPGQSGNPKGRPRKLTRMLEKALAAKVPNDPEKRNQARVLIDAFIQRAISGSDAAAKEIFERMDGKVPNKEEISGPDGIPLQAEFRNMSDEELDRALREELEGCFGGKGASPSTVSADSAA